MKEDKQFLNKKGPDSITIEIPSSKSFQLENNDSFASVELGNEQNIDQNTKIWGCSHASSLLSKFKLYKIHKETCHICQTPMKTLNEVKFPQCQHAFCKQCVELQLKNLISTGQVLNIKCPEQGCSRQIDPKSIKLFIHYNLYRKQKAFKKFKELSLDPNVRWCIRANCEKQVKRIHPMQKRMKCECGQEFCFDCMNDWHEDQTCAEAMDILAKTIEIKLETRKCPKCGTTIEKFGGCNHLVCSTCNQEFCWLCLKKYKKNHYAWWNLGGCPGMQYYNSKSIINNLQKCGILLKKCLKGCWIALSVILLVPLFLALSFFLFALIIAISILAAPLSPQFFYQSCDKKIPDCTIKNIPKHIIFILVGILLTPFIWCVLPIDILIFDSLNLRKNLTQNNYL